MTTILLVRHGQASFGSDDYDRLSDLGHRQARLTGRHLAAERRPVARIVSGGLRRQRETAKAVAEALGVDAARPDRRLDEFSSAPMFKAFLARARERVPELAGPWEQIRGDGQLYGLALREVTRMWTEGAEGHEGESWAAFDGRTEAALRDVAAGTGHGDLVVVCTSGGVIGASLARILGTGGAGAMALSRQTLNCGISEIRLGRSETGLRGFNSVAHLRLAGGQEMITRR